MGWDSTNPRLFWEERCLMSSKPAPNLLNACLAILSPTCFPDQGVTRPSCDLHLLGIESPTIVFCQHPVTI